MENYADDKRVKNNYHFLDTKAKTKKYFQSNKEKIQKWLGKDVNIWKTFEIKNMENYHDLCLNVMFYY